MTITGSLSNALSGLTATARAAELVSSNVANAMTEGYGVRELALSSRELGGAGAGVRVEGVLRNVDEGLVGDRRLADAALGHDRAVADFLAGLEDIVGTPEKAGSLSGRLARFEATLVEAASRPDSEARLSAVLDAAQALAAHLNTTSDRIQEERMQADQQIALQVETLNAGLIKVQNLNYKIQEAIARGVDPSSLMDLRQQTIDQISPVVPLKQVPRDNGMVALFTTGGAILLDGKAAQLGFSPVGVIVPEMTQASGALSGLTINGQPARTDGLRSPIQGGSLAGLFEIRDILATDAQIRLDAVSRDLVERFQDPAVDATRPPGAAGLFTDSGAAFAVADEVALSSRLQVNDAVDPAAGGALWRLRDGLGAASPGDVGNAALLNDLKTTLTASRIPASGGFIGAGRSASSLAAEFLSLVGADRRDAEAALGFSTAQQDTLKLMELRTGVDTDYEMQKLMLIEQAYAANARVITTAGEMIQTILGM